MGAEQYIQHKQLSAFTLVEMLVSLILTSGCITLGYQTLNYTQDLFERYRHQQGFIERYCRLKNNLSYQCLTSDALIERPENMFAFIADSAPVELHVHEKFLLLRTKQRTDTFRFDRVQVQKVDEPIKNPDWQGKLLKALNITFEFGKQTFDICLHKKYEAMVKLKYEKTE